jgi:WD40 repeat protein
VSEDGAMRCWDTKTRRARFENPPGQISAASFDPTGTKIITTGDGKTSRLWDLAGKPIRAFEEAENPVFSVIDPTGAHVLTSVPRDRLKIWDAATGAHVSDLVGHSGRITCFAWSWDGTRVITGSLDETVRIWDARTGDTLASVPHRGGAFFAAFTPDGKSIVLGGADGSVEIRELPRYDGSVDDLHRLMQCRVPFEVRGDRLQPRERSFGACVSR